MDKKLFYSQTFREKRKGTDTGSRGAGKLLGFVMKDVVSIPAQGGRMNVEML